MQTASPLPLVLPLWQRIVLVGLIGLALRGVAGLEPVWWLVWIAPAPLLALACRSSAWDARASVLAAALIGTSANFHYFTLLMPLPLAALSVLLQALLWYVVIMGARRVVLRYRAWWTVFAYPVLWTAADTLMAHCLPDGNWGSIGYTQAGFLPALQWVSLFGVPGLVFLLAMTASALALPLTYGRQLAGLWPGYAAGLLLVTASMAYGASRLQSAAQVEGMPTVFGLVAIDDFIGAKTPPALAVKVWRQYDAHIEALARQGAQIIVLPEKIAVITPAQAMERQRHLAALAARLQVWIEAGIGIDDGTSRTNMAWLLAPTGALAENFQKHHMAPPEREFIPGREYSLHDIGAHKVGLAICKDMHFGTMGLAYGQRKADVMLVPAWDFYFDGEIASSITLTRGVENGFAIARSSREGLLTVTDAYGRVVASKASAILPGSTLLASVKLPRQLDTLYTRIGDVVGWLCLALAGALLIAASGTIRHRHRS